MKLLADLKNYSADSELIFFGGTFDPWHEGHYQCLELMPKSAQIFLVPDRNPFKSTNARSPQNVYQDLQLQITSLIKAGYQLDFYGDFLRSEQANPTYQWIQEIHNHYPTLKLSLLMGYDSFKSLPQWIKAEQLLPMLYALYVVSRNEAEYEKIEDLKEIEALAPNILIQFLGHHEFEDVSSTELRKKKGI